MSQPDQPEYDDFPPVIDTEAYEQTGRRPTRQVEPVEDFDAVKHEAPEVNGPKKKSEKIVENGEESHFWSNIFGFFTDRRTHGFVGVALILFAAYVLVASLSFFVKGREDQSAVNSFSVEQMSQMPGVVENMAGPTGAVLTQVILTDSLGLGAMVMIFYLILIGLALLRVKKVNFWSLTFKSLLISVTISMVAGLVTYNLDSSFLFGGQHGRWINTLLIQRFEWIGAALVSLLLVSAVAFIYLNELLALYRAYRSRVEAYREQERLAREEREEKERKVKEGVTNELMDGTETDAVESDEETDTPVAEAVVGFTDSEESGDDENTSDPFRRKPEPADESVETEEDGSVEAEDETETPAEEHVSESEADVTDQVSEDESETVQESCTASAEEQVVNEPVEQPADDMTSDETPDDTVELELDVREHEIEMAENVMDKPYDPTAELSRYHFPPIDILKEYETKESNVDLEEQEANKERIAKTLKDYGINISKIEATVGPTITLFQIIPVEGTRIQQIKRLGDDLMLSLAALGIRIIAPIPGTGTIGIEVPNQDPQTVSIRSILSSKDFQECKYELPMAMGATISNKVYIADLAEMPHMLVAGATGQGKSVGLNTVIASLLYKKHPATLKFVLVDPKMVEFSLYSKLERHYLAKLPDEEDAIITSPDKVVSTLNSLCVEMDNRYSLLRDAGCRSLIEYNNKFTARRLNPEKGHRYMPYIVIIVDEFADLIMTAGKEVETPIARIAQKARAVGMHMIIATQRPSTNVITGVIKANFPGRMAFKVAQGIDSKTILDRPGANQLIGRGDMLISSKGKLDRVQCAFISTQEVEDICSCIDEQAGYEHAYYLPEYIPEGGNTGNAGAVVDRDPLFEEAARIIVQAGTASTSSLQRRYAIGYNRAGKIMDQMEAAGIVGPAMGGKPRQVLMDPLGLERLLEQL